MKLGYILMVCALVGGSIQAMDNAAPHITIDVLAGTPQGTHTVLNAPLLAQSTEQTTCIQQNTVKTCLRNNAVYAKFACATVSCFGLAVGCLALAQKLGA